MTLREANARCRWRLAEEHGAHQGERCFFALPVYGLKVLWSHQAFWLDYRGGGTQGASESEYVFITFRYMSCSVARRNCLTGENHTVRDR